MAVIVSHWLIECLAHSRRSKYLICGFANVSL